MIRRFDVCAREAWRPTWKPRDKTKRAAKRKASALFLANMEARTVAAFEAVLGHAPTLKRGAYRM